MAFFKRKKTPDVIDLGERFRRQQARTSQTSVPSQSQPSSSQDLGFFGAIANTVSNQPKESSDYVDMSESVEERRRKLSKQLRNITEKIEDLSNQIYHLQQRVELLERKTGVGGF